MICNRDRSSRTSATDSPVPCARFSHLKERRAKDNWGGQGESTLSWWVKSSPASPGEKTRWPNGRRHSGSYFLNEWMKEDQGKWVCSLCASTKGSGYAVYALLPKKDERYKRKGIKVEPKWLGMGKCIIFRTMKFLGRSHYKESFHQDHILSYIWWKRCVSFK